MQRVTWTRLNIHYRPAVELPRLILTLRAPDLTAGSHHTASLTIDMADLFEDFVREALREALHVSPTQFPAGNACRSLHLDSAQQVRVHPDLSLWLNGQCRFIGDVKYKRDTGPGHNDDLYQLLAYATAAQLPAATSCTPMDHRPPAPTTSSERPSASPRITWISPSHPSNCLIKSGIWPHRSQPNQ
jgi:5-methylcytosine-specific restriction enzyme subunit McrC